MLDEVRLAKLPLYFSSEKARSDLGYSPRPAAQALAEATDWFYGAGWSSGSGSAAARSSRRARRSAVDSART